MRIEQAPVEVAPFFSRERPRQGAHFQHRIPLMLMLVAALLMLGCAKQTPPIGSTTPISTQRLINRQLADIRNDVSWKFARNTVIIDNADSSLPDYLKEELTLEGDVKRVHADWAYDEATKELVLTSIERDGEPVESLEVRIRIEGAGPIRANLGSRQYNLMRN